MTKGVFEAIFRPLFIWYKENSLFVQRAAIAAHQFVY